MKIKSAQFEISSTDYKKCPPPIIPEYGFIGRSNVGKSSLINMLVDRKEMAHTSGKPGKTQLINHFIINDAWYIVDLPGYGYATLAKSTKETFDAFVRQYILNRPNLLSMFVLIDIRLPMQKRDKNFMEWLALKEVPFVIVFTKADKLGKTALATNYEAYKAAMLESWEVMPMHFMTSSKDKVGRDDILGFIEDANRMFKKPAKKYSDEE